MGLFDFWKKRDEAPPAKPTASPTPGAEPTWDEATRQELRETIRNVVLGEVRLNRSEPAAILETCREVYIEDQAPENERAEFLGFAAAQIKEAAATQAREQASWPRETDCDRLDRVEEDLRKSGILLWQVSPCCDTCSNAELPDRIDVIEERHPGFRETLQGYAFYIDQNMPDMLAESTQVSLYLGYGWFAPEGTEVAQDVYEGRALGIADRICASLKEHGFDVNWNGALSQKIGVSLNWQRRTMIS